MPTILADTFHTSLAKLNGQEQKQAKLTAFDLHSDASAPGLKLHRIDKSKDQNFRSVRVSRDLRIIIVQQAGAFEEAGDIFDPETARRLETFIYSAGYSRAPDEAYEAFRGRPAEPGPLLRQRSLVELRPEAEV